MNDNTFQWSLIGLSVAILAWWAIAIVLRVGGTFPIAIGWSVILGIVVWLVGGGVLLRIWGKSYMERE